MKMGAIVAFNRTNDTGSFNFKSKIIGKSAANGNDCNTAGRVDLNNTSTKIPK